MNKQTRPLLNCRRYLALIILAASSLFFNSSCMNMKKVVYFNNIGDTLIQPSLAEIEPVIQKSDILSILISSLNPEATMIFNSPQSATTSTSNGTTFQTSGYLVNQDGNILFPVLGTIKAAGLTIKQLSDEIIKSLIAKKLLVDPIVSIRFLNYRVTVLGEVARPTVISVSNEKISLLEAIGMAGDLTIFAKRESVMIIREMENGKKLIKRINLNSTDIFTSPYYYLKTNDIVYAEPNKNRIASSSYVTQVLPIVLSALSLAVVVVTTLAN
jgi:polysaccharide export outer membrane protein